MGEKTEIAWTDHTFNPWWGCQRVSPGCERCYAEMFDKRTGGAHWGPSSERRFFGAKHWAEPLKWNAAAEKAGERRRVFCASMADVFEDRRDLDSERAKLLPLIAATTRLDWQLLTKRPQNIARLAPWIVWPTNVWMGTTVEDQKRADERLPFLAEVPARVHFVSVEPLLEAVDLRAHLRPGWWVIIGGESGPGARPFVLGWASDLIRQCREVGAIPFFKQAGSRPYEDTNVGSRFRIFYEDRKGGDILELPDELRVREFPEVIQ